jgi:hypothetical protein
MEHLKPNNQTFLETNVRCSLINGKLLGLLFFFFFFYDGILNGAILNIFLLNKLPMMVDDCSCLYKHSFEIDGKELTDHLSCYNDHLILRR